MAIKNYTSQVSASRWISHIDDGRWMTEVFGMIYDHAQRMFRARQMGDRRQFETVAGELVHDLTNKLAGPAPATGRPSTCQFCRYWSSHCCTASGSPHHWLRTGAGATCTAWERGG